MFLTDLILEYEEGLRKATQSALCRLKKVSCMDFASLRITGSFETRNFYYFSSSAHFLAYERLARVKAEITFWALLMKIMQNSNSVFSNAIEVDPYEYFVITLHLRFLAGRGERWDEILNIVYISISWVFDALSPNLPSVLTWKVIAVQDRHKKPLRFRVCDFIDWLHSDGSSCDEKGRSGCSKNR